MVVAQKALTQRTVKPKQRVLYLCPRMHYNFLVHKEALEKLSILHIYQYINDEMRKDKDFSHIHYDHYPPYYFPKISKLLFYISKKQTDLVLLKELYTFTSLLALIIARMRKIPVVVVVQKVPPIKNRFFSWLAKKTFSCLVKKSHAVSVTDIGMRQLNAFPFSSITYIPFGVPIPSRKRVWNNRRGNTLTVISVTKASRRKQVELLFDALRSIHKTYGFKIKLHLCLTIQDQAYYQELRTRSSKLGREGSLEVVFHEHVPHSTVESLYLLSDLYVLSSYNEPAAYSHLEAMSFGLPVICSSENGTASYIDEGTCGYLFTAKDLASLRKAIENIVVDTKQKTIAWKRIASFGAESRRIAVERHSKEAITSAFRKLLS